MSERFYNEKNNSEEPQDSSVSLASLMRAPKDESTPKATDLRDIAPPSSSTTTPASFARATQSVDGSTTDGKLPGRFPTVELFDGGLRAERIVRGPAASSVEMNDGTYHFNSAGRVEKTVSKDGSMTRAYKYEDASDPSKITSLTLNGKTEFSRIGPQSFAVYELDGLGNKTLRGNWHGAVNIDKDGLLTIQGFGELQARQRGAAAKDLSAQEVLDRKVKSDSGANGKDDPAGRKPDGIDRDRAKPQPGFEKPKPAPDRDNPTPPTPKPAVDGDRPAPGPAPKPGIDGDKPTPGPAPKPADSDRIRPPIDSDKPKPPADRAPAAGADAFDGKKVTLPDGTYERDDQGRISSMTSPDGKTKRAFKYEDSQNPNRITSEVVNDKTEYKYLGPVTVSGQPWKENGFEVNSYSIYENGNLVGNWAGVRSISPNGVYSTKESSFNAEIQHQTADGKKLTDEQRQARDRDGIWPNKLEITTDDGTKYTARLKGTRLDSLTETRTTSGETKEITWKHDGAKWTSDEQPARERKNLELRRDGSLRYEDMSGAKHVEYKDGRQDIITDGVTRSFDKSNKISSITQQNGDSRQFGYTGNELTSITDRSKNGTKTWSREAGSDEWKSGDRKENRKDLKVLDDGSVEYKLDNGNKVRLSKDFARVELDQKDRPVRVEFESGSARTFSYSGDKLNSVTDTVNQKGKEVSRTWTRDGESNSFTAEYNGKKHSRTIGENPTPDGDYKYTGTDGKERTSHSRDVERLARGETFSTSENVQEAKENLLDACNAKGIKTDRVEKYLVDLEKGATKYGITPEKLAKTLDNLTEILTSPAKSPLYDDAQRKTIFETALHNLARPMEIDQGYHPTCNVTTVEIYAAVRHPEEYSRMCKEITLQGNYKTSDGKTITPPKAALLPGEDERSYDLDKPNTEKRNFASQLVQMTLINGVYELGGVSRNGSVLTNTRYVLDKITWRDLGNGSKLKVGEDRLTDLSGRAKEISDGGPNFTQGEVLAASKMMLGYDMPYIKGPVSYDNGNNWQYDLPSGDRLLKAKQDKQLPLGVPTIGGAHVQTIHDVHKDSRGNVWVLLDNQHGEKKDGWVTLDDLHRTQRDRNYECEPTIRRWQRPQP